jgi:predicted ATP-grasp superfamily ATP-dependent carboligase
MVVNEPVLIYGIETPIGLSIIRELGSHKIPVYGIAKNKNAIGLASKYLKKGFYLDRNKKGFFKKINAIIINYKIKSLITISESDMLFFNNNKDKIKIQYLFPSNKLLKEVLIKENTYKHAAKLNIKYPKTIQINSIKNIPELKFPVILKWSDPNKITPILKKNNIELIKAKYCYSYKDLINELKKYRKINLFPIIQEFCPGIGIGIMVFMKNNKPYLVFQHKRLREYPPEGGTSTFCKSIKVNKHLAQKSIELLKSINWVGPAMVEYRYDNSTNDYYLMEINGRYWGSLPLAYYSKAYFAFLTYKNLYQGLDIKINSYKKNIFCRYFNPDLKRLFIILFKSKSIQNKDIKFNKFKELSEFLLNYFWPTKYYLFSMEDSAPFFKDLANIFKKILKK